MNVLSFRKSGLPGQDEAQDWSQQELADFCRAQRLLEQNGVAFGIDRGLSDVGDPWFVFYDYGSNEVFLHVARFDGKCFLACETLALTLTAPNIQTLMAQFEKSVRAYLSGSGEQASNVLLHPAARIVMSVSAVFLLFKLDGNGQADAKEQAVQDAEEAEAESRKDGSHSVRIQNTIARLLDAVDNPAAIAALAGAILAGDLLLEIRDSVTQPEFTEFQTIEPVAAPHVPSAKHAEDASFSIGDDGPMVLDLASGLALAQDSIEQIALSIEAAVAIAAGLVMPLVPANSDPGHQVNVAVQDSPNQLVAWKLPVTRTESSTEPGAEAPAEEESTELVSLATEVLQKVAAWDWADVFSAEIENIEFLIDAGDVVSLGASTSDINVHNLGEFSAEVAFVSETALRPSELVVVLDHLIANLGAYEVEFSNGRWLIEQRSAASLDSKELGIWTNTMMDGSTISIVGHVDLIDDVQQHLLVA